MKGVAQKNGNSKIQNRCIFDLGIIFLCDYEDSKDNKVFKGFSLQESRAPGQMVMF